MAANGHGRSNGERTTEQPAWKDFVHTGPGTLAGRYMRTFWQPVYRAEDLPAGRAVPIRVMGEDFTLYRGEGANASVHLLAFRCAHRGTQLSTGWVEGDNLRCFYHGWAYDPAGQCIEQPAEPEPFCERIRIRSYLAKEYLGLIFGYFGEGDPPPLPRYPDFEEEGVLEVTTYRRLCNYFNNVENGLDNVHVAFVHRISGFADAGLVGVPIVSGEESEWGITMRGQWPRGLRVIQYGLPTVQHIKGSPEDSQSGWVDALSWRVPVDDAEHRSFNLNLVHVTGEAKQRHLERQARRQEELAGLPSALEVGQAILRGEGHSDDYRGRPDLVNIQDNAAQVGQGAIADREHERLGRSDVLVVLLRQIWERELRALAEGRPLKQWRRTAQLETTAGV